MREIKFRAWVATDYDEGDNPINFHMVQWSRDFFDDTSEVTHFGSGFPDGDDCILMQYTGLKDKNGKEIYEGDIVQETGGLPCEVYWRDEAAGFEFVYVGNSWMPNVDAVGRWFEVIGNIYENPELLP